MPTTTVSAGINFEFSGLTNNPALAYNEGDVVMLTSISEAFPFVVIEAMVNKVCMIAVNNGGPLEIIDNGVDGLLFDRSSEDLTKKIKTLCDDKIYKDNLAQAGYAKAKNMFNSDEQNKKLYDVIRSM